MPEVLRKLRMYEPVWEALKKHKTVTLNAKPSLHKRIAKAIQKEKWADDSFKQREGWRMMWLTHISNGNEITFSLSYKLNELVSKDL